MSRTATADGGQGQGGSSAQSQGPRVFRYDAVQKLQQVAPIWAIINSFDCRDDLPRQQVVEASRLVELYASKTLSRSTLVVGLLNTTRPLLMQLTSVSAAFFRPLEYVLELVEGGGFYKPVTADDLQTGLPPPDWCLPLHMQLQVQASGVPAQSMFSAEFPTLHILASSALTASAYWCLVHKYHEESAKCDFNWQPRDLVAGLISKAVSPYTLVIGIDVHKDRNLPWMRPSLFVPLAAILHMHQSGVPYTAVTRNDLVVFNVLGFKGAMQAVMSSGAIPQLPEPLPLGATGSTNAALAAAMQNPSTSSNPDMGDMGDSEQMMALLRSGLRLPGAPPTVPGGVLPGLAPKGTAMGTPHDVASALAALNLVNVSNGNPLASKHNSGSLPQLHNTSATLGHNQGHNSLLFQAAQLQQQQQMALSHNQAGAQVQAQEGLLGFSLTPQVAAEAPSGWETPVFRLFTCEGATQGACRQPESRWWFLEPHRALMGPFTAEQMLIAYIKGIVTDDMMVCGTSLDVMREGLQPTPPFFESLGSLLRAVQHGGSYALVTAEEVRASAVTRVKPAASTGNSAFSDVIPARPLAARSQPHEAFHKAVSTSALEEDPETGSSAGGVSTRAGGGAFNFPAAQLGVPVSQQMQMTHISH